MLLCMRLALLVDLVAFGGAALNGGGQGTPAKADPQRIAQLIEQLGDLDSTKRQAASTALAEIGLPALVALKKAAGSTDPEVARRAARLIEIVQPPMDRLLDLYRDYGLPLPPDDAKLVRIDVGSGYIVNGQPTSAAYLLGFLLQPATKEKGAVVLVGTSGYRLDERGREYEVIEPRPAILKNVEPCPRSIKGVDRFNAGLATALQFRARGWNDLAQALWSESIKQDAGHHIGLFYHPPNLPPRTAVAYLAWTHYCNELVIPGTDRARIAKQMKKLLAAEASLSTDTDPAGPLLFDQNFKPVPKPARAISGRLAILQSLEATLAPSKAKLGTVESLVDDLTEMCNTDRANDRKRDARYEHVALLGFEAIPALMERLDDNRLTRSVFRGFNNFPPRLLRVRDLVTDILQDLAGDELGPTGLQRVQGWTLDKATAQKWWQMAREIGEEAYVVDHILPKDVRLRFPHYLMLEIVAKKYPTQLLKVYRAILDDAPRIHSWTVAEAVSKSSVPAAKQRELFVYASAHKDLEHRRQGLFHLLKLDPEQAVQRLVTTLDNLPATPSEPYWGCPEVGFTFVVLATDDPRAWKALERFARRADVGLRMELIGLMTRGKDRKKQQLAFLSAFLDDPEVRDVEANPKMFTGPYAVWDFPKLTVQDFAAWQCAYLLEISERPDASWTNEQWAKLRARVKHALPR